MLLVCIKYFNQGHQEIEYVALPEQLSQSGKVNLMKSWITSGHVLGVTADGVVVSLSLEGYSKLLITEVEK